MPTMISVKAKKGRVVRERAGGPYIPTDRFVSVPLTSGIERAINRWGDLEVEEKKSAAPAPVAKSKD